MIYICIYIYILIYINVYTYWCVQEQIASWFFFVLHHFHQTCFKGRCKNSVSEICHIIIYIYNAFTYQCVSQRKKIFFSLANNGKLCNFLHLPCIPVFFTSSSSLLQFRLKQFFASSFSSFVKKIVCDTVKHRISIAIKDHSVN